MLKTERCREHLSRTERELYGILQRKYQLMRGGGPQGSHSQSTTTGGGDSNREENNINNIHSLKQILTMGETNNQVTSTPLAANLPIEELADVYKVIHFFILFFF